MTKQEQIEEMAKEYCKNEFHCSKYCQTEGCKTYEICEALYNAGYRKIDDDCALITKDELKQYKLNAIRGFSEKLWYKIKDKRIDYKIFLRALVEETDEILKE